MINGQVEVDVGILNYGLLDIKDIDKVSKLEA